MPPRCNRLKAACYVTNVAMAVVCNFSPLLFLTFHALYGVSYSLLGFLVLIGYVTQLGVDLLFSFFAHKFNLPLIVKLTPFLTFVGLLFYALFPFIVPDHAFVGIVIGSVIFSASGGLGEVLLSPTIASIPAKDPDRAMSALHSVYAWGVVGVILFSTLFFALFGVERWQYLALLFSLIPLAAGLLYIGADIPPMARREKGPGAAGLLRRGLFWSGIFVIFCGGAAEGIMSQWSSGYLELALGIPKVWGDIFGVAMFALMLALGRTLYGKIGKHPERVLFFGVLSTAICYLFAALSPFPVIGLVACGLTGFCVSMLWPGSLIVGSARFPAGGVFLYAMMAAAGDLGFSVGPQIIGGVTDAVAASARAAELARSFSLLPEQFGMKIGILLGTLFSLAAAPFCLVGWRRKVKAERAAAANAAISAENGDERAK